MIRMLLVNFQDLIRSLPGKSIKYKGACALFWRFSMWEKCTYQQQVIILLS
jgi:hypothetical protein